MSGVLVVAVSALQLDENKFPVLPFETKRARRVLEAQGLIEPLIVNGNQIVDHNPHHPAFFKAAIELNWPTVIVVQLAEVLEQERKGD